MVYDTVHLTFPSDPTIYTAIGTTGGFYNGSGVPQTLTAANAFAGTDNLRVYVGTRGVAVYSTNQSLINTIKIRLLLGCYSLWDDSKSWDDSKTWID